MCVLQIRNLDRIRVSGEPDAVHLADVNPNQRLRPGYILIGLRAKPIRASVVTSEQVDYVASSNLAVLLPRQDKQNVNPYYLAGLLRSQFLNRTISRETGAGKLPSLNLRIIRSLKFPLPSVDKQAAIADAFEALERYRDLAYDLVNLRTAQLEGDLSVSLSKDHGT